MKRFDLGGNYILTLQELKKLKYVPRTRHTSPITQILEDETDGSRFFLGNFMTNLFGLAIKEGMAMYVSPKTPEVHESALFYEEAHLEEP